MERANALMLQTPLLHGAAVVNGKRQLVEQHLLTSLPEREGSTARGKLMPWSRATKPHDWFYGQADNRGT